MPGFVTIERTCPQCGKRTGLDVNSEDYKSWVKGELIQNAFPHLSREKREFLISGVCSDECWQILWPDE